MLLLTEMSIWHQVLSETHIMSTTKREKHHQNKHLVENSELFDFTLLIRILLNTKCLFSKSADRMDAHNHGMLGA